MPGIEGLTTRLINSHWPECERIVQSILEFGCDQSKPALLRGLEARRHHVRTAAIKGLGKFQDDPTVLAAIRQCLDDPAYETRVTAKKLLESIE